MSRALVGYVLRTLLGTQRYAAPLVLLLVAAAVVLGSPPLDLGSAQVLAVVQMTATAWLTHLTAGTPSPAQEAVTATRCGSRRAPLLAALLVGLLGGLLVPVTVLLLGAATGHVRAGIAPVWVVAVSAPALAGAGLGILTHAVWRTRPGYAVLGVLAAVTADLVVPGAPPLNILAGTTIAAGPAALAVALAGALVLLGVGTAAALHLHLRR